MTTAVKQIRKVLKTAIPGVRFSVRTDATGVQIHYSDHSAKEKVDAIADAITRAFKPTPEPEPVVFVQPVQVYRSEIAA
jgi:hypothetical protein